MTTLVKLFHRECHNDVCKMVSFTYGSGFPALWLHENLSEETHEWLKEEFGNVTLRFFKQMGRCVRKGRMVSYEPIEGLPADYGQEPKTRARFSFFAGQRSRCFLPESQMRTHAFMSKSRPNYHTLHLLPEYSHLDVFIGKAAARDVFPMMLEELDRGNAPPPRDAAENLVSTRLTS